MDLSDLEEMLANGAEEFCDVLNNMADRLYDLADSIGPSSEDFEEIEALNAGKTEEEIKQEDALAAMIAAPIVNVIDGLTDIVNGATQELMAKITESNETTAEYTRHAEKAVYAIEYAPEDSAS